MLFKNRQDAGRQLAQQLEKYKGMEGVVYGLPRGGVPVAAEIARALNFSLGLIFAHKIGHPFYPEYAIAAVSEDGHLVVSAQEVREIEEKWFENEKKTQMEEIKRKRALYLKDKKEVSITNKIAVIVDDGIATGLTMRAGILELKERRPKKIIAAVPVSPKRTAEIITGMVDEFTALKIPEDGQFLGSVGSYYRDFSQVEDSEVAKLLLKF